MGLVFNRIWTAQNTGDDHNHKNTENHKMLDLQNKWLLYALFAHYGVFRLVFSKSGCWPIRCWPQKAQLFKDCFSPEKREHASTIFRADSKGIQLFWCHFPQTCKNKALFPRKSGFPPESPGIPRNPPDFSTKFVVLVSFREVSQISPEILEMCPFFWGDLASTRYGCWILGLLPT